jgi:Cu2+-exporting ATPase
LHSEHAIARSIVAAGGADVCAASNVEIRTGQGVSGSVAGETYVLGRYEHAALCAASVLPLGLVVSGERTVVYLARQGQWLAALVLGDSVRAEAGAMLAGLRAVGCGLSIFSGDAAPVVAGVARVLDVADARAGLTPEGKHAALRDLQASGSIVAMVGDGINDAPVLAQAHVSIAMAGGTELARNQADILLLNDALDRLLLGRRLARKTLVVIRENLAWALVYNLLAIPAAMAGWVTPWIAGIGMGASSLLVVLNALRIARVR